MSRQLTILATVIELVFKGGELEIPDQFRLMPGAEGEVLGVDDLHVAADFVEQLFMDAAAVFDRDEIRFVNAKRFFGPRLLQVERFLKLDGAVFGGVDLSW